MSHGYYVAAILDTLQKKKNGLEEPYRQKTSRPKPLRRGEARFLGRDRGKNYCSQKGS